MHSGFYGIESCKPYGQTQDTGPCETLRPATFGDELLAESARLERNYPLGNICHDIGGRMRSGISRTYQTDIRWAAYSPATGEQILSGDYHPEPAAGPEIHIAFGHNSLNPDRYTAGRMETARHEWAHDAGYLDPHHFPNGTPPAGVETAADVSIRCGSSPVDDADGDKGPVDPAAPFSIGGTGLEQW